MRDHFTTFFFVTAITLASGSAVGGIYKYLDENGQIAYSDKPVEGAKRMNIQLRPTPEPDEVEDVVEELASDGTSAEVTDYESLELLTPTQEKVISDRSGSVQVIALPTPRLSRSHELVITVDGKDISRGRHANLNLSQVSRGTHIVSARILDASGTLIITSPSVTFYVQKP